MPSRVPVHQVVVHRDGKNIYVPIGKPFDFTQEEIEQVLAHDPNGLRRAINESRPEVTSEEDLGGDPNEIIDDDGDPNTPPTTRRQAAAKRRAVAKQATTTDDDEL